jgi:hypothetical protein
MKKILLPLFPTLERYAIACSAALVGGSASGAVIHYDLTGADVPLSDTEFLFIDVDAGTFAISDTAPVGYDLNFFAVDQSDGLFQFQSPTGGALGFTSGPYAYIDQLGAGVDVDALAGTFLSDGIMAAGYPLANLAEWNGGVTSGYVGFQFQPGATTYYGWARLSVSADLLGNPVATVHEMAYENTGASIATGAVPEPSALGLLAAGAAGLAFWRRNRRPA